MNANMKIKRTNHLSGLFCIGSQGSAMVEGAIIFCIILLFCTGVISRGITMYSHVRDDAVIYGDTAEKNGAYQEDILRAKWVTDHIRSSRSNQSGTPDVSHDNVGDIKAGTDAQQ